MKKRTVAREPKPFKCYDHPKYHGDRKPTNGCEACMKIWQRVNEAQEDYLSKLFERTVGRRA